MRWRFQDPALLWLFPITYLVHLAEEVWSTAPILLWRARLEPPVAIVGFVAANMAGLLLMVTGVVLVGRGGRFDWIVPALAVALLLNTAGHFAGSIAFREYSAGLTTAMMLWVPLAGLTLLRVWDQSTRRTLVGGAVIGALIEALVFAAMRAIAPAAA